MMRLLRPIIDFFCPHRCVLCHRLLDGGDSIVCGRCTLSLPLLGVEPFDTGITARLFWGRIKLERAAAIMHYTRNSLSSMLVIGPKYQRRHDISHGIGTFVVSRLFDSHFFDGIDIIVPMPTTEKRLRERGGNRIEIMAQQIVAELNRRGHPIRLVADAVCRLPSETSQTALTLSERLENVKSSDFIVKKPHSIAGHVLLFDDVITSGATMTALAQAITAASRPKALSALAICRTRRF